MEPAISLPCSQKLATGSYPEPDESRCPSSLQLHTESLTFKYWNPS